MVLQEYPEDGAASSDSQMLLSFEEFKQIMDEWDVIPIFVNPHKFAQHKQVGHSTMLHAVERSAGATAAVLLDSCNICQQYCSTCHDVHVPLPVLRLHSGNQTVLALFGVTRSWWCCFVNAEHHSINCRGVLRVVHRIFLQACHT
jgi:hypothetical protein